PRQSSGEILRPDESASGRRARQSTRESTIGTSAGLGLRARLGVSVEWGESMNANLAAVITKAASKQTYYTIRFLVDRARVEDAYRAYAYFRWVDDVLDADAVSGPVPSAVEASERRLFLERQKSLLDQCLRGEAPRDVNPQENMLVELVQGDGNTSSGL